MGNRIDYTKRAALFSPDRQYRHWLIVPWDTMRGPVLGWCGLNPSIADEKRNDPTVRREIGFSKRAGFSGMVKINLYPFVATDPKVMWRHPDPVGPDSDVELVRVLNGCAGVVLAWGRLPARAMPRARHVISLLREHGLGPLYCLGTTKDGQHPLHPVRLSNARQLQPPPDWRWS